MGDDNMLPIIYAASISSSRIPIHFKGLYSFRLNFKATVPEPAMSFPALRMTYRTITTTIAAMIKNQKPLE